VGVGTGVAVGVGGGGVGVGLGVAVGAGAGVGVTARGVTTGAAAGVEVDGTRVAADGSAVGTDVGDEVACGCTLWAGSPVALAVTAGVVVNVGLGAGFEVAVTSPPRNGGMPLQCPGAPMSKPSTPVNISPANPNVNVRRRTGRCPLRVVHGVPVTTPATAAVVARSAGVVLSRGAGVASAWPVPPSSCARAVSMAAPISGAL